MKKIKIQANPKDWDLSILRAEGVERNCRMLSPVITAMIAAKLPEPHLSVWRSAVEEFRTLGNGEWNAGSVIVTRDVTHRPVLIPDWIESEVIAIEQPESKPCLVCDITANYPDGTRDMMTVTLTAPEMLSFFDYFTDSSNWPNPQADVQP